MRPFVLAASFAVTVSCGRAALAPDLLEVPPAVSQSAGLAGTQWLFDYVTAAHCNSWTRTWSFQEGGRVDRKVAADVSGGGPCTRRTTSELGTWTVAGVKLSLTWPNEQHESSFAVFEIAPRLDVQRGKIGVRGSALSAYGFELSSDGTWVGTRSVERSGVRTRSTTRVSVVPPLTAENEGRSCTFEVRVSVERGRERAEETIAVPCSRMSDGETGWRAAGAFRASRYSLVEAAGVYARYSPELASAVYDAFVAELAVHSSQPKVAVPLHSTEESRGWMSKAP